MACRRAPAPKICLYNLFLRSISSAEFPGRRGFFPAVTIADLPPVHGASRPKSMLLPPHDDVVVERQPYVFVLIFFVPIL
jgi:hypothetical protein